MQITQQHSDEELFRKLNEIQGFVDHLASILWKVRVQVKRMMLLQQQMPLQGDRGFSTMLPHMNKLLVDLIQGTVVVDRQPPQVLKTQTKFTASVRCLSATALNMHMDPPEVTCSIVNELQAQLIVQEQANLDAAGVLPPHSVAGELMNNRKTMHYANEGQVLFSSQFKNIQLKKHKRGGLKSDQVVTEEKFAIVFQLPVRLYGEMTFQVRVMSTPVVVVVHGNQQANAEATVLWDNHFAEPVRLPFTVPASVPWSKIGKALSHYFSQNIQQPLTAENLGYLATKLLAEGTPATALVTWQQFCKESLAERQFTFWDWFYAAADLIKKHLLGPWQANLIHGFVSKQQVQEELIKCESGTFILRFSDSAIGGITIAWVGEDENGLRQVWNLQPWYARDFAVRKLAERIQDLPQLVYLYPRIPKDSAFETFCSEMKGMSVSSDYVQSGIAAVIPRGGAAAPAHAPPGGGGAGGGGGVGAGGGAGGAAAGAGGAAGAGVGKSPFASAFSQPVAVPANAPFGNGKAAVPAAPAAASTSGNVLPPLNSLTGDLGLN
jgi:signal transducer and activator of transcription 5B